MSGRAPMRGELTDEASLRALAHPIRWALIEALSVAGTATAAQCAKVVGESHGSCSFHLRQLARFGLVEEAPSTSKRERPWRLTTVHQNWSAEPTDDPARDSAALHLSRVFVDRETERIRRWTREQAGVPAQWRRAAFRSGSLTWLTPKELQEVSAAIADVMLTYLDRIENPEARPARSKPVRLFAAGYPVFELDPESDGDVGPA